ncbi:MAG: hypothetical protein HYR94_16815 [Chloroflexi bacterium]|nr:hypothetical protein [Chloroflexota bacterium]
MLKVRLIGLLVVCVLLVLIAAQCGPAPTPEVITKVETVIVEKEGEKVVETVEVVKEVEVEKVVTVEVEKIVEICTKAF